MIDKNGKLFGKINLIDLIIVIILIVLAAFVVFKFAVPRDNEVAETQLYLSLFCEETPDYILDYLEEGTPVYDSKEDVTIGTVESLEIGEPTGYEAQGDGSDYTLYQVSRDDYSSVKLRINATGVNGVNGATIEGVLYGVGHTMTVYAGQAKLYLRVSGIEATA